MPSIPLKKTQESFPVGCRTLTNLHSASLDIQGRIPAADVPGASSPLGCSGQVETREWKILQDGARMVSRRLEDPSEEGRSV